MRPVDELFQVRAELISLVARTLAPLYPGERIDRHLPEWLAGLPTQQIAASMRGTPDATASALAHALLVSAGASSPEATILDLAATEFPRLTAADQEQLARFTLALREKAIEHGGQVEFTHMRAAGYGLVVQDRWKDKAEHLLKVASGEAPASPATWQDTPARRLQEIGARAAVRHTFAADAA